MKLQDKINAITDKDFLPGLFDSWRIYLKENEFSLERCYMNVGFSTEADAEKEKALIIRDRIKNNKDPYFLIEVRHSKVRRLKKPISVG